MPSKWCSHFPIVQHYREFVLIQVSISLIRGLVISLSHCVVMVQGLVNFNLMSFSMICISFEKSHSDSVGSVCSGLVFFSTSMLEMCNYIQVPAFRE